MQALLPLFTTFYALSLTSLTHLSPHLSRINTGLVTDVRDVMDVFNILGVILFT